MEAQGILDSLFGGKKPDKPSGGGKTGSLTWLLANLDALMALAAQFTEISNLDVDPTTPAGMEAYLKAFVAVGKSAALLTPTTEDDALVAAAEKALANPTTIALLAKVWGMIGGSDKPEAKSVEAQSAEVAGVAAEFTAQGVDLGAIAALISALLELWGKFKPTKPTPPTI